MKKLTLGVAVLMLTGGLASHAAGLPSGYPPSFQRSGVIDELPGEGNQSIVVSDARYFVGSGLVVHTPQLARASIASLHTTQRIGFSVRGQGPGTKGTVTEVWVLPKDYKP